MEYRESPPSLRAKAVAGNSAAEPRGTRSIRLRKSAPISSARGPSPAIARTRSGSLSSSLQRLAFFRYPNARPVAMRKVHARKTLGSRSCGSWRNQRWAGRRHARQIRHVFSERRVDQNQQLLEGREVARLGAQDQERLAFGTNCRIDHLQVIQIAGTRKLLEGFRKIILKWRAARSVCW